MTRFPGLTKNLVDLEDAHRECPRYGNDMYTDGIVDFCGYCFGTLERLKPLVLYLKKEYFDQVRSGNKIEEYREVKPYWTTRLVGKEFSGVEIRGGSHCDKRTSENTLVFPWKGYSIKKLVEHPLFGKTVEVYAIKLVKANE